MKRYLFLTSIYLLVIQLAFAQEEEVNLCAEGKIKTWQKAVSKSRLAATASADNNIDVGYYKLNLNVTYEPKNIKGEVTISARSKVDKLNRIFIDLTDTLTTDSIKAGVKKLSFSRKNAQISIQLDKDYRLGELINIRIYYHGIPGTSGFDSFVFGKHNNGQDLSIWSLSEPFGASDWFPCKNAVDDKADSSDVWVTAPSYFVTASNGILEKVTDNGNNTKTYQWKNRYPIAQYLISLAMSNYKEYRNYYKYSVKDSMLVQHFIYPEQLTEQNKTLLDGTVYMIDLFSKKFGLYPFIHEKYGHAQFGWGGGMEHQTCTSIVSFEPTLVAHELMHQWFGDKITCKNWENIWLNEGFASYGECIYVEASGGRKNYDSYIANKMVGARKASGTIYVQNPTDVSSIFNTNRTYSKGASVLHMLRGILGDEVFFSGMKKYLASGLAYSNATTEDYQAIMEKESGKDLAYFFKQWIYGLNYPKYNVVWEVKQVDNDQTKLGYNITQTVNINPQFFTMPFVLRVKSLVGKDTVFTDFKDINNQLTQDYLISVKGKPLSVQFDPDNLILKDVQVTQKLPLGINEASQPFELSLGPNPAEDILKIRFNLTKTAEIHLEILNLSGNTIFNSADERLQAGSYEKVLDLNTIEKGNYLLRFWVDGESQTRKLQIR
ncbi:Por secretion system C-terminal sorting domain-containing protein [Pseudarcicella hirudinis]|uniref:Aminopeptidase N n=1 Tax=Pseudarcicella hirudinis TaxID=1079859 RepID=A0A1I5P7Q2_9BACT|nr:M1 family aminopeptidase [Pseudarcicella hirudinis]SFP29561.1 Por secretion system C-terminal sorting domain-containing protein [Pseudarcicella hirudinis]